MTAEQAFDENHKAVYRFIYRLVGQREAAEDITQDCFLALLRHPDRWDSARGDMKAYLFSIARNLAFKRYRDQHIDALTGEQEIESIRDQTVAHELPLVVAQLVSQLPDLQREALILFEYEGFQLSEIAVIVGEDVGVVKSRLHRARERLKRSLVPFRKVGAHEVV